MIKLDNNIIANTYYTDSEGKVWFFDGTNKILYSSADFLFEKIFTDNANVLKTQIEKVNNNSFENINIKEDNIYGS